MVSHRKGKRELKFYARILCTFTIIIVLIVLAVSSIFYLNFKNSALGMMYKSQKDSLNHISNSAVFMCDTSKTLAKQIYFDRQISNLFNFDPDSEDLINGLTRMELYSNTVPYVDSIYVYSRLNKKFYINATGTRVVDTEAFHDREILDIIDNFQAYKKLEPIPRKAPYFVKNLGYERTKNAYTFVFYDLPGKSQKLDNVVIVNISEDWMRSIIKVLGQESDNDVFIVDKAGRIVLSNSENNLLTDMSETHYVKKVLESSDSSGYFSAQINGEEYLIVYSTVSEMEWKFIRKILFKDIMQQMQKIRDTAIVICLVILAAGLLVSFIASRITYKPVDRVLTDLEVLQSAKRSTAVTLKQTSLQKILLGNAEYTEIKAREFMESNTLSFDFFKSFLLVLIRIDKYDDFCRRYNSKDRSLLKFGILNIVSETFSHIGKNEAVDMNDDRMVLLLNLEPQEHTDRAKLTEILNKLWKDLETAVANYINISVTLSVSSTGEGYFDIAELYKKTEQVSMYRMFYGYGSILHELDIEPRMDKEYILSRKDEKRLNDALLSGSFEAARGTIREIILEASVYSYKSFNYTIIKLAMLISDTGDKIAQNYEVNLMQNFNEFIGELNHIELLEEIFTKFDNYIDEIEEMITSRKNNKYDEIVKMVAYTIHARYMEQDLSINSLAEAVNLSPGYLGKLFKRSMSISIVDYINNVRVNKAKDLLANTSYTVNEIVEKVGFTNSNYFFPLFKKVCGITPREYRINNSKVADR